MKYILCSKFEALSPLLCSAATEMSGKFIPHFEWYLHQLACWHHEFCPMWNSESVSSMTAVSCFSDQTVKGMRVCVSVCVCVCVCVMEVRNERAEWGCLAGGRRYKVPLQFVQLQPPHSPVRHIAFSFRTLEWMWTQLALDRVLNHLPFPANLYSWLRLSGIYA